jgi:hypothetical protein
MAKLKFKKRILPEAGKHLCTLVEVNEVENKFFDPKTDGEDKKKRLEWIFAYTEKPEMKIRVWSSFSLTIYKGNKSKALTITETLLEKVMTDKEKEEFSDSSDTDGLLGKQCYITVKHEKKDDGEVYANVLDFEGKSGIPF